MTNDYDLPEVFGLYEQATHHSKGEARYSVTELIDSPRIGALKRINPSESEGDISDELMAIWGTAVHMVLEKAAQGVPHLIPESRYTAEFHGVKVSGGIDLQTIKHGDPKNVRFLSDYKTTMVKTVMYNKYAKPEWARQLNGYAAILRQNGVEPTGLEVVVLMRDWSRTDYTRTARDYPPIPLKRYPIKLWDADVAQRYMEDRVDLHVNADLGLIPPCTDEEMWTRPQQFAVHVKTKGKNPRWKKYAAQTFENFFEADLYAAEHQGQVKPKPQKFTRCDDWCEVAEFCDIKKGRK